MISFQSQCRMNQFLHQWLKLEIMIYFTFCLLIKILPKNLYSYPKCSPADSRKLNYSIFRNWKRNCRWMKSWMQFNIDSFNFFTKIFISRGRLDKQSPSIFILLISLQNLCCISHQKSCQNSFLYYLLFLRNAVWIKGLKLVPKLMFSNHLIWSKLCSTERTSLILNYKGGFTDAILAKYVLTLHQTQRLIIYTQTYGTLMILKYLLFLVFLLSLHQQFVNKDA